ncbi:uncharacterized protein LTR77_001077 [Saxophila tyrrhenica]|uniref:Uncharacterized protein n=1 Tax=Saxophila tyrrhenica TaxID=1690608 RepID=A0AAV9PJI4_9PEZI|nr:hypothetical protein LTR77_001077 [Saxophila tyrrhenica]
MAGTSAAVMLSPTPTLHLPASKVKNVVRLERTAERMSSNGSDLGEEIRRLSRGNSVASSNYGDTRPGMGRVGSNASSRSNSYGVARYGGSKPTMLERGLSTRSSRSSSHGVNAAARGGGYSPNGYVTSPVGSPTESWPHASLSRVQSGSKTSRLAQVSEPLQEGRPLDSPLRPSFSVHEEEEDQDMLQTAAGGPMDRSRDVSQTSFGHRYDQIAGQIAQSLEHVPPSPPKDPAQMHREDALQQLGVGGDEMGPRRPSSTDTYREAQLAFKDFDGVHFSPDTDEYVAVDEAGNEVRRVSARSVSGGMSEEAASMLRTAHDRPVSFAPPPPEEDMVYYPAPVPRMLNLPKRLSQLPSADVQAKRRSQMLGVMPDNDRAGAPWLAQEGGGSRGHSRNASGSSDAIHKAFLNERMSGNMSNLPPQLRANMYFEHQPVQHDVEVKSESAVATLDDILAASATAPIHAFTDHPFAGDVRSSVYSMEHIARKSTATLGSAPSPEQKKIKKRRSSSIGALLRRATSNDQLTDTLKKRNSRGSIMTEFTEGGNKLRKRQSQLSMGTQLEQDGRVQTPASELREGNRQSGLIASAQNADEVEMDDDRRVSRAPTVMSSGYKLDDADQIDEDFKELETQEDAEEGEPVFVQPSTLLAELQVRKMQLKSRNRTAATAFPRGMHSTLLELDAVEEISKRKRQQQRIALAWEDPHQRALEADMDKNDEDVPLGMLFPGKDGATARKMNDGKDWDRPLGLMEKRLMEDSEPLSNRRNRLRGVSPGRGRMPMASASQLNLAAEVEAEENGGEEEDEHAGETLGERLRRLRTKRELDGALADITGDEKSGSRPVSRLVDDVMSQFGGLDVKDENGEAAAGAPPRDEEETLGQRRARLQREREAGGERNVSGSSADRPGLQSRNSFANLLTSNPVGQRTASKTYEPAQGSLLHSNERIQARHRNQLQATNTNSAGLGMPLVDSKQQAMYAPNSGGLLGQQHNSRAPSGGFAAGTYNNGMGGVQPQPSPMGAMSGYFSPNPGMNGYGYAGTPGMMSAYNPYQQQQQQQQMAMMQMQQQQQQQQQAMRNPAAYHALHGGHGGGGMGQGINGFSNAMMNGGGTYASFAQNQGMMMGAGGAGGMMGMGGMGMMGGLDEEGLDPKQKAAIDRWRVGVAQQ